MLTGIYKNRFIMEILNRFVTIYILKKKTICNQKLQGYNSKYLNDTQNSICINILIVPMDNFSSFV